MLPTLFQCQDCLYLFTTDQRRPHCPDCASDRVKQAGRLQSYLWLKSHPIPVTYIDEPVAI